MTHWVLAWLRAFGLTLLIEELIAVPLLSRWERKPRERHPHTDGPTAAPWTRIAQRVASVALVNVATHPLVWFLFPGLKCAYATRVILSEIWAFSAEGGAYWLIRPGLPAGRAFLTSVLANGASLGIGLLL